MIVAVVKGVKGHFARRSAEWFNTAICAYFGLILIQNQHAWNEQRWSVVAHYFSQNFWCGTIIVVSALRLSALGLNGTFPWFRPYSPTVRAITAFLSAFVWLSISSGLFLGDLHSTGAGTYFVLMIEDLCLTAFIAGEAGAVYRSHYGRV